MLHLISSIVHPQPCMNSNRQMMNFFLSAKKPSLKILGPQKNLSWHLALAFAMLWCQLLLKQASCTEACVFVQHVVPRCTKMALLGKKNTRHHLCSASAWPVAMFLVDVVFCLNAQRTPAEKRNCASGLAGLFHACVGFLARVSFFS